jgi:Ca2+-binding RTX toxin-like protein
MFSLRRLWQRITRPTPARRERRPRLQCETLEDRRVPAVFLNGSLLTVRGTAGDDNIRIAPLNSFQFRVVVNNAFQGGVFSTANISQIQMLGLTGNDVLNGTRSLDSVILQGGAGNDQLFGSRFSDLLIGSTGNDTLRSGGARDVMIGGLGTDTLNSVGGGALMVGGNVTAAFTIGELNVVRNRWGQPQRGYLVRIASVRQTGFVQEVFDDGNVNVLNGSNNTLDWFFRGSADQINNANSSEVITPVN